MVSVQPHLAGSASGLGGAMTIGGGAALSVLASSVLSKVDGTWPRLLVMLATGLVALHTTDIVRLQEKRQRRRDLKYPVSCSPAACRDGWAPTRRP
jgi:DHA1 family bicyclomycin/chloramphenicol resistance-like MFS transporter